MIRRTRATVGIVGQHGGISDAMGGGVNVGSSIALGKIDAAAAARRPAPVPRVYGIDTDIGLDLGRHFRVSGNGLDSHLRGAIRLRSSFPEVPRATGAVSLVDGLYHLHGRRLKVRRGRVVFDGPLDDPTLDIVAVREALSVEPGVAISGTALSPLAMLISNPEVADVDRLAWLVLGTGSQDAQGPSQMLALQTAGATLFGEVGARYTDGPGGMPDTDLLAVVEPDAGNGRSTPSAGSPGADPTVGSQGIAASVGRRLASGISATCEQSLRAVWNILKLQYEITDRLSLSVQAGNDGAADLLVFNPFD